MKDLKSTCRIALVQAEPVMFDKEACLSKALDYIHEAAREHAELIVFPELFIPGYPIGLNFGFSMGNGRRPEGQTGNGIMTHRWWRAARRLRSWVGRHGRRKPM